MKRHNDALAIQEGAVNISAMARTLVQATDEARSLGVYLPDDSAIKLIIHQMAFIAGIISGAEEFYKGTYGEATSACKAEVAIADTIVEAGK